MVGWKSLVRAWCQRTLSQGSRSRARRLAPRHCAAEVLEPRQLLSAITVTTLADNLTAGDGQITLREALLAANTNASVDGSVAGDASGQDEIVFQPGLTGTIQVSAGLGQLQITESVKITGLGAKNTVIDALGNSRVFDVTAGAGDVGFSGVTITGGNTTADHEAGAGIRFLSSGALTITNSAISNNTTWGFLGRGAGIFTNVGAVTLTNSLISGNITHGAGGDGAALFSQDGAVKVINSTVSGNKTYGYHADGAALYTDGPNGSMVLTNSTVTANENHGPGATGSAVSVVRAALSIANSIISGNTIDSGNRPDMFRSYYAGPASFSLHNSLIGVYDGVGLTPAPIGSPDANGNYIGTVNDPIDPRLAALADNGGPTLTHALLAGSVAINSGSNAVAVDASGNPLITDQRGPGFPRIDHGVVDMGSFEFDFPTYPLVVTTANDELDGDVSDPNDLSLREAIFLANANAGQDTITFAASLSGLPIQLTLGELQIAGSLIIEGLGAKQTTIDALGNSRVFDITTGAGDVGFSGVTITGGNTTADNEAGAGIRFLSSGTLTVTNSAISNNTTWGFLGRGAGIFTNVGAVTLTNSLISGNITHGAGGDGAALFSQDGAVKVINSTVSGNKTYGYHADGAALYTDGPNGSMVLTNSTVTANENHGPGATGSAVSVIRAALSIANSIISGNTIDSGNRPDMFRNSASFSLHNSLIGVYDGVGLTPAPIGSPDANGNYIGTVNDPIDPRLAALADNGGPTLTHALLAGSVAINGGSNALAVDASGDPLTTDQRGPGFPRIDHGVVDMGSFEFDFPAYSLVVTTASDELDSDLSDPNDLSLREAIFLANANAGLDTITFAAGLSGLPIRLTLGQLQIVDTLVVEGLSAKQTTIDAQENSRVFDVKGNAGDVTLIGLTITGGKTTADEDAGSGAGVRFLSSGQLTIIESTIDGSSASGVNARGGGLFSNTGHVVIRSSTISGNSISGAHADGGGVYVRNGDVTVVNSTFSGNSVGGDYGDGGAIYAMNGDVTLTNTTITQNHAAEHAGGVTTVFGSLTLENSIVAGNSIPPGQHAIDLLFVNYDRSATFTAYNSLIGTNLTLPLDATAAGVPDANGNHVGTDEDPLDPRLDVLADNGGPTKTHAILADSPAINGGRNSLAVDTNGDPLTTDQRGTGFDRIIGGSVDIGAFESDIVAPEAPIPQEATLEGFYFDENGQLVQLLRSGDQITLITGDNPSALSMSLMSALLTQSTTTDWNTLGAVFDPLTGSIQFPNGDVWEKVRQLNGAWLNGQGNDVGIRQLGTELTFINRLGQTASGHFLSATQVIATGWGDITGTLTSDGQRILWSNGTTWDLVPQLEGGWSNAAHDPTRVEQAGSALLFFNRLGHTSSGKFLDARHVLATDWGQIGTLINGTIHWSNGTSWSPETGGDDFADLGGIWDVNGQSTKVLQNDGELTFVNRFGGTSSGHFLSVNEFIADQWNVRGQLVNGQIIWSNGNVWKQLPDLGGPHIDQLGRETRVGQLGRSLILTGPQGQVTHGTILGTDRVNELDGIRRSATIVGNSLLWNTGGFWSAIPDLRGNWANSANNLPTYVEQSGLSVLFINESGESLKGRLIGANLIQTDPYGPANIPLSVIPGGTSDLAFSNGWHWETPPESTLDSLFADPREWPLV